VNYASEIRRFLLSRFGSVRLILFEHLVFPGVLEDVVLVLAEGTGGADSLQVYQMRDASDLQQAFSDGGATHTPAANEKWTAALVPIGVRRTIESALDAAGFERVGDWGTTSLGAVTGASDFFCLSDLEVEALGLPAGELLPVCPPGTRQLHTLRPGPSEWQALKDKGLACYLFRPSRQPSAAAQAYIRLGSREGVDEGFKCRVRAPWWRVPLTRKADLLVTYMNHDRPRRQDNQLP